MLIQFGMHPNFARLLASLVFGFVIAPTLAQPSSDTPPVADAQVEVLPSTTLAKPLADRVAIMFKSATGETTRTIITARWEAGGEGRKPRLRLSMGRLDIFASAGRLIAISRSDPSTYFEATLPDPVTPASVRAALPPIPLPHIEWCFGMGEQRDIAHPYGLVASPLSKDDDGLEKSSTSDGILSVWKAGTPPRPRRVELQATHGSQLHLALTPIDVKPDDSWEISTEGRRKVSSIAELRVDKAAPMIGRPLKDLGFTAPDFSEVSLADLFAPNLNLTNPNATRASIVLVVASTKEGLPVESATQDLASARTAIDGAVETLHARDTNAEVRSRVNFILLRGLPLAELDVQSSLSNAAKLAEPLETSHIIPRVRNTTSADWVLKDQLGECSVALLVLDGARVVISATALDARSEDAEAVCAEVVSALERALGISPPTISPSPAAPATTEATPSGTSPPK